MSALQDLLTSFVGRGRQISVEQVAREADVAERTVHRWLEGESEPTLQAFRNMLASVVLAARFRKALSDYLHQRCHDLRVVLEAPTGAAPHDNPLRLTFDQCQALVELQRAIDRAQGEFSDGGPAITEAEQAEIGRLAGEIDRLTAELRRSVGARVTQQQQQQQQRTA
jgi:transcriptional regulator with XRE-family HTH domain